MNDRRRVTAPFVFLYQAECMLTMYTYISARPVSNSFAWLQTSRKGTFGYSSQRRVTTLSGIARPCKARVLKWPTIFGDIRLGLWWCTETKPLATFTALTSKSLNIHMCDSEQHLKLVSRKGNRKTRLLTSGYPAGKRTISGRIADSPKSNYPAG